MAKVFEIYLHRCRVNGKGYVGLTCCGVRSRLYSHESDARHGSERPFARAIRKYGIAAFETTVLASGLTEDQAKEAEQRFIAELDTFGMNGYNATLGGEGTKGVAMSDDRRAAISRQFSDLERTEIHRSRISHALRGKPKAPHVIEALASAKRGIRQREDVANKSRAALAVANEVWAGSNHSSASRNAMRLAKSVELLITYPSGNFERRHSTIRAVAEETGISATAISVAMRKGRAIKKPGPLFGCVISKVEGGGNGRAT